MFVGSWCRRYTAHLNAVGAVFHTTASVNAARLSVVGLGVMLLFLSLWDPFFTLRIGYILPVLRRWCRHSASHVIGVGATFLTTVRVNTARSSAVGVGLMLPL